MFFRCFRLLFSRFTALGIVVESPQRSEDLERIARPARPFAAGNAQKEKASPKSSPKKRT